MSAERWVLAHVDAMLNTETCPRAPLSVSGVVNYDRLKY